MANKIVTFRWTEPEAGQGAEVWNLTAKQWPQIEAAIAWVAAYWEENENSGDGEDAVGNTIVATGIHATKARTGHDARGISDCLQRLADNVRYSTGEGLYEQDCPIFAKHGIARS